MSTASRRASRSRLRSPAQTRAPVQKRAGGRADVAASEVDGRRILRWGLLLSLVVVPLVFSRWTNEEFELPKLVALRCVLLVTVAAALIWQVKTRGLSVPNDAPAGVRRIVGHPALWVALAVAAAWLLSMDLSGQVGVSWWGTYQRWNGLRTQLGFLAVFCLAAMVLSSRDSLRRVYQVTAITAAVSSTYAVVQAVGADPFSWSQVAAPDQAVLSSSRPFGTLGNPAFLSAYLAIAVFLTAAGALTARRFRWAWWTGVVLECVALGVTASRAAWLAVIVAAALLGAWLVWRSSLPYRRASVLGAFAALVAVAALLALFHTALPPVGPLARIASAFNPSDPSISERLTLWQVVSHLFAQRPLVGYGPDNLGAAITQDYPRSLVGEEGPAALVIDRAHNALLDALVSVGAIGVGALVAVGGVVVLALVRLMRRARQASDETTLMVAACAAAGLLAHLVEQQFNVEATAASALAWVLAGALVGWGFHEGGAVLGAGDRRVVRPWLVAWLVIGFVAVGATAGLVWEVAPLRADAAYARGLQLEAEGRPETAVPALEAAVQTWPWEPTYWNELARARFLVARDLPTPSAPLWQASQQAGQQAVLLAPLTPLYWSNLGLFTGEAAAELKDATLAQAARQAHQQAVNLAPDFWLYWRDAGATEFKLGDFAGSESDFGRAVSLWDKDRDTDTAWATAAQRVGDADTVQRACALLGPADEPGCLATVRAS